MSPPEVPESVSVKLPGGVEDVVFTVSTEDDVAGFGLNEALVLDGRPLTLNVTAPLNPDSGVTVTV